jgi:hypothetical protein
MLDALGISAEILQQRGFVAVSEATSLVLAEVGEDGREYWLTPAANQAWQAMKNSAAGDGIALLMISAFRSVARQTEIIQAKLAAGRKFMTSCKCVPRRDIANITLAGRSTSPRRKILNWKFHLTPQQHSGGCNNMPTNLVLTCLTRRRITVDINTNHGTGVFNTEPRQT